MSTLPQFAQAVQDPDLALPLGLTSSGGRNDPLRFAVYRNNVHVSLVAALAKGFPVVGKLVGEEFFGAMARIYVGQTKPSSPLLFTYGADFPAFIAGFPPAASLPYLPDIARLEYVWTQAYHAADDPVLTIEALRGLASDDLLESHLEPHPAAALVASHFPIGSIWQAHQHTQPAKVTSNVPETILMTRPALDVIVTVVPARDAVFARSLLAGDSVGESAAASATTPGFDLGAALVGLVSLGAFTQLQGAPQ
ncbi:MAG: DNA-binding domain-containing protein [Pelagibacterium sp.]|uniref:HvfC/BufC N-terminal domain-containing protein n=1 Tax=Pelagibacterium sp. TaxID=1967288 RepID=UPI0032EADC8E